jgi:hypothetical protein
MHLASGYRALDNYKTFRGSFHNHTLRRDQPTASSKVVLGICRLCGIPILPLRATIGKQKDLKP